MQIRQGSLLIANPRYAPRERQGQVVYITESTDNSTMGLTLNHPNAYSLPELMSQRGITWPNPTDRVGVGGEYSPTALIMLHTNEWYSTNTMPVSTHLSISSDMFMLEKLEAGATPSWYRLFMGTSGWTPQELAQELRGKRPQWLLLPKPSLELLYSKPKYLWDGAVRELSQDVFSSYI